MHWFLSLLVVKFDTQRPIDDWILTVGSVIFSSDIHTNMTFLLCIVTNFCFLIGDKEMLVTAGSQYCGCKHYVESLVRN